jgi:exodeoxyribonuclease VII large subunit
MAQAQERLARSQTELGRAALAAVSTARNRLAPVKAELDALSPLAVLSRGYAIAWNDADGQVVRDAASLNTDDVLTLRFGKGGASARVESTEETNRE